MVNRFTVHIVSHYRADRLPILRQSLGAISQWQNCLVEAVITTNSDRYLKDGLLEQLQDEFEKAGHSIKFNVVTNLKNPRLLTWEHKKFMRSWCEDASVSEDYFVYLEDDLLLTQRNIRHFVHNKEFLAKQGLIPGFLRYEVKDEAKLLVDIIVPEWTRMERTKSIQGKTYHANANPYWAGFILDKAQVKEYLASKSFSIDKSQEVCTWNIQERAAMGLTFENVPFRLSSRAVIRLIDGKPDPDCLIWHCSDSYSKDNHPHFARLTVEDAYPKQILVPLFVKRVGSAIAWAWRNKKLWEK